VCSDRRRAPHLHLVGGVFSGWAVGSATVDRHHIDPIDLRRRGCGHRGDDAARPARRRLSVQPLAPPPRTGGCAYNSLFEEYFDARSAAVERSSSCNAKGRWVPGSYGCTTDGSSFAVMAFGRLVHDKAVCRLFAFE